jgi:peptide-methionine (S)-S-oxide reductase
MPSGKWIVGRLVTVAIAIGAVYVAWNVGIPSAAEPAVKIPAPAVDTTTGGTGLQTAVIAGGCFWGIQAVYAHTKGVTLAVSGYSGGTLTDPTYKAVITGHTGHAEAVKITYDPKEISYGKILQIFFSVAHNPTQLNYQGPDHGTQYRSAIFPANEAQAETAKAYIAQLDQTGAFDNRIATEVTPLSVFYPAEDYHQDYAFLHPSQPYIVYNDLPKIENLKAYFPDVWRDEPVMVGAKPS